MLFRSFWSGFGKLAFFALILLGTGLFAYQMGIEQLKGRDVALREEVASLSGQKAELELLAGQMQHAARAAEGRVQELEARLARQVPTGELASLTTLVRKRLADGLAPQRLAFVIENAQNPRNCQPAETKRFVVTTPLVKSGSRSASFAGGAITVTGEGESARNAQGAPEAWFDPTEPVSVRISAHGGVEEVASGLLPLHHSVVIEQTEHRFTIAAGPRSFVEVTADRCPFP